MFPLCSQLLALPFRSVWRSSQCTKGEGKRNQGREREEGREEKREKEKGEEKKEGRS